MIRIGINGFGRIGRALFRLNLSNPKVQVVAINDINPDIENNAYLLQYDTTYQKLRNHTISTDAEHLIVDGQQIRFYCHSDIAEVPWQQHDVDVVIDSSGIAQNVFSAHALIERKQVKKVVVTHAAGKGLDMTLMLGVNEADYDASRHHVISSSICDANAVGPFFKAIDDAFGVEMAEVTTLHPWLQYQNLLDGNVGSVSNPGHQWSDYSLGRSSIGSLIPKETTLVRALSPVLPGIEAVMHAASFRTPTSIVSAAEGVLLLKCPTDMAAIQQALDKYCAQYPDVLVQDGSPLVSVDYVGVDKAAVLDTRWLHLNGGRLLKFVLWYDNEWGYASRALNVALHAVRS